VPKRQVRDLFLKKGGKALQYSQCGPSRPRLHFLQQENTLLCVVLGNALPWNSTFGKITEVEHFHANNEVAVSIYMRHLWLLL